MDKRDEINTKVNAGLVLQQALIVARSKPAFREKSSYKLQGFAYQMEKAIWAAEIAIKELKLASSQAFWSAQALQSNQSKYER